MSSASSLPRKVHVRIGPNNPKYDLETFATSVSGKIIGDVVNSNCTSTLEGCLKRKDVDATSRYLPFTIQVQMQLFPPEVEAVFFVIKQSRTTKTFQGHFVVEVEGMRETYQCDAPRINKVFGKSPNSACFGMLFRQAGGIQWRFQRTPIGYFSGNVEDSKDQKRFAAACIKLAHKRDVTMPQESSLAQSRPSTKSSVDSDLYDVEFQGRKGKKPEKASRVRIDSKPGYEDDDRSSRTGYHSDGKQPEGGYHDDGESLDSGYQEDGRQARTGNDDRNRVWELEQKVAEMESEKKDMTKLMERSLNKLMDEKKQLKNDYATALENAKELEDEVDSLKKQMQKNSTNSENDAKKNKTEWKRQIQALEEELENERHRSAEAGDLAQDLEDVRRQKDELEDRVAHLEDIENTLKKRTEELQSRSSNDQDEVKNLRKEVADAKKQAQGDGERLANALADHNKLSKDLQEAYEALADRDQRIAELAELEGWARELQSELDAAQELNRVLRIKVNDLEADVAARDNDIAGRDSALSAQDQELRESASRVESLTAELDAMRSDYSDNVKQRQASLDEIYRLRDRLSAIGDDSAAHSSTRTSSREGLSLPRSTTQRRDGSRVTPHESYSSRSERSVRESVLSHNSQPQHSDGYRVTPPESYSSRSERSVREHRSQVSRNDSSRVTPQESYSLHSERSARENVPSHCSQLSRSHGSTHTPESYSLRSERSTRESTPSNRSRLARVSEEDPGNSSQRSRISGHSVSPRERLVGVTKGSSGSTRADRGARDSGAPENSEVEELKNRVRQLENSLAHLQSISGGTIFDAEAMRRLNKVDTEIAAQTDQVEEALTVLLQEKETLEGYKTEVADLKSLAQSGPVGDKEWERVSELERVLCTRGWSGIDSDPRARRDDVAERQMDGKDVADDSRARREDATEGQMGGSSGGAGDPPPRQDGALAGQVSDQVTGPHNDNVAPPNGNTMSTINDLHGTIVTSKGQLVLVREKLVTNTHGEMVPASNYLRRVGRTPGSEMISQENTTRVVTANEATVPVPQNVNIGTTNGHAVPPIDHVTGTIVTSNGDLIPVHEGLVTRVDGNLVPVSSYFTAMGRTPHAGQSEKRGSPRMPLPQFDGNASTNARSPENAPRQSLTSSRSRDVRTPSASSTPADRLPAQATAIMEQIPLPVGRSSAQSSVRQGPSYDSLAQPDATRHPVHSAAYVQDATTLYSSDAPVVSYGKTPSAMSRTAEQPYADHTAWQSAVDSQHPGSLNTAVDSPVGKDDGPVIPNLGPAIQRKAPNTLLDSSTSPKRSLARSATPPIVVPPSQPPGTPTIRPPAGFQFDRPRVVSRPTGSGRATPQVTTPLWGARVERPGAVRSYAASPRVYMTHIASHGHTMSPCANAVPREDIVMHYQNSEPQMPLGESQLAAPSGVKLRDAAVPLCQGVALMMSPIQCPVASRGWHAASPCDSGPCASAEPRPPRGSRQPSSQVDRRQRMPREDIPDGSGRFSPCAGPVMHPLCGEHLPTELVLSPPTRPPASARSTNPPRMTAHDQSCNPRMTGPFLPRGPGMQGPPSVSARHTTETAQPGVEMRRSRAHTSHPPSPDAQRTTGNAQQGAQMQCTQAHMSPITVTHVHYGAAHPCSRHASPSVSPARGGADSCAFRPASMAPAV